jgi:hypothetical protein
MALFFLFFSQFHFSPENSIVSLKRAILCCCQFK